MTTSFGLCGSARASHSLRAGATVATCRVRQSILGRASGGPAAEEADSGRRRPPSSRQAPGRSSGPGRRARVEARRGRTGAIICAGTPKRAGKRSITRPRPGEEDQAAEVAKALSHPLRIAFLRSLREPQLPRLGAAKGRCTRGRRDCQAPRGARATTPWRRYHRTLVARERREFADRDCRGVAAGLLGRRRELTQ
ncbi:MAG: hypothetical protein JWO14_1606 [Solirubrobacterales bacterium]|nr:hypothetical protein [Solirubrobacterales bacterium]